MWAQQRAVYGNIFGFPGGVAWAMLVARICQLYPNAVSAVIVEKFFHIYSQWAWPQPVLLKQIEDGPLQVRVWNPRLYALDRQHRMPVITPAYPSMCATHNITSSTQKVILSEFQRGIELMNDINVGKKSWSDLLERHDFFFRYKFYLCIVAATRSTYTEHLKYSGMVESKLRLLVQKLELVEGIELAHPYVKSFENGYYCDNAEEAHEIMNLYGTLKGDDRVKGVLHAENNDKNKENVENKVELHMTKLFIGLKLDLSKEGEKKLDIQYPCAEFFNICKGWQDFDSEKHFIQIKNVKLYDLLDDVYVDGETRPIKIAKRKRAVSKNEGKKKPKSVGTVSAA